MRFGQRLVFQRRGTQRGHRSPHFVQPFRRQLFRFDGGFFGARGIGIDQFGDDFQLHVDDGEVMAQRVVHFAGQPIAFAHRRQLFHLRGIFGQLLIGLLQLFTGLSFAGAPTA